MGHDYKQLCRDQLADLRTLIAGLTPEQWQAPTLCEGWTAKDVIAHMLVGRVVPIRTVAAKVVAARGDVGKVVDAGTEELSRSLDTDDLVRRYNEETSRWPERGVARIQPPKMKLSDNLTHHLDIAWPAGIPTALPEERLVAVLDAIIGLKMWGSKQRAAGLRLAATDTQWSTGQGPEVSGPAEALILALGGRPAGLERLSGDGLPELTARVKAA